MIFHVFPTRTANFLSVDYEFVFMTRLVDLGAFETTISYCSATAMAVVDRDGAHIPSFVRVMRWTFVVS
jgi:hypothetical protein